MSINKKNKTAIYNVQKQCFKDDCTGTKQSILANSCFEKGTKLIMSVYYCLESKHL